MTTTTTTTTMTTMTTSGDKRGCAANSPRSVHEVLPEIDSSELRVCERVLACPKPCQSCCVCARRFSRTSFPQGPSDPPHGVAAATAAPYEGARNPQRVAAGVRGIHRVCMDPGVSPSVNSAAGHAAPFRRHVLCLLALATLLTLAAAQGGFPSLCVCSASPLPTQNLLPWLCGALYPAGPSSLWLFLCAARWVAS